MTQDSPTVGYFVGCGPHVDRARLSEAETLVAARVGLVDDFAEDGEIARSYVEEMWGDTANVLATMEGVPDLPMSTATPGPGLREHRQQEHGVLVRVDPVRDHGRQVGDESRCQDFGAVADGEAHLALEALHHDRVCGTMIGQGLAGTETHGDDVYPFGRL